jgi:hypothetical protein
MEIEQLIADVNSVQPKNGFKDRLKKIRDAVKVQDGTINLEAVSFENFESHDNHSDWDNRTRKPETAGKLLKLKTITLKAVSEICGHTDHSDHNDFTDTREV